MWVSGVWVQLVLRLRAGLLVRVWQEQPCSHALGCWQSETQQGSRHQLSSLLALHALDTQSRTSASCTSAPLFFPSLLLSADYALSKPGTLFVTVRQLLAWMQNPQPIAQLSAAQLGCGNAGGAPGPGIAAPEEDEEEGIGSSVAAPAPAPQAEAAELEQAAAALAAAAAEGPAEAAAVLAPAEAPAVAAAEQQQQQAQQPDQTAAELQPQQPAGTENVQQQGAAVALEALESGQPDAAAAEGSSTSISSSNLPAIIAGAVGGAVAAIAAIAAAALLVHRRRRQRAAAKEAAAAMSSNGGWINRQGSYAAAGALGSAGVVLGSVVCTACVASPLPAVVPACPPSLLPRLPAHSPTRCSSRACRWARGRPQGPEGGCGARLARSAGSGGGG